MIFLIILGIKETKEEAEIEKAKTERLLNQIKREQEEEELRYSKITENRTHSKQEILEYFSTDENFKNFLNRIITNYTSTMKSSKMRGTVCWRCHSRLSTSNNEICVACGWLVCSCGACSPNCFRTEIKNTQAKLDLYIANRIEIFEYMSTNIDAICEEFQLPLVGVSDTTILKHIIQNQTKILKYNRFGYDINGYNRNGYNKNGYDKFGYDKDGYDSSGYNKNGRDRDGFDKAGFNEQGCTRRGFNADGIHSNGTEYDENGFDIGGYDCYGFHFSGRGRKNFNMLGEHRNGTLYDEDGYNYLGYNREGFHINGYNKAGFNRNGIHKNGTKYDDMGYDCNGFDKDGFNAFGYNALGYDREGYNYAGFNQNNIHKNGTLYDEDGYDVEGWDKLNFPEDKFSEYSAEEKEYIEEHTINLFRSYHTGWYYQDSDDWLDTIETQQNGHYFTDINDDFLFHFNIM